MNAIVGIDEVGRGCWAGPLLVVAARAKTELPKGLADSKTLSRNQREALMESIIETCDLGLGWVQSEEIDTLGLTRAMQLGVSRALMQLGAMLDDHIIIDGLINYCSPEFTQVETLAKADSLSPIVSAASVYAKVMRDRHMVRMAKFYPFYGFEQHVGYGTELHRSTLKMFGVSPVHRRSYKPIQQFLLAV